ncbi:MHYT domain-containing protein [Reinekea blandensis]|uniref:Probable signalling protein n=1 Tax=Reinekea blandensis MED297 TaxID=314283 RepID=A4BBQ1_9GAMM|nr:MHYT domain-containing protein [Reinekea blandensis]EAR10386.1 probable signalling protein [Reinekea sp. MED297] [Reinekea blandensis MED297]
MIASYDLSLVLASYLVAVIASFSAIYFSTRVRSLKSGSKPFWFAAGVICLGGGIWSMHFVGMSAYNTGFNMTFDLTWTLLSLVVVLVASGLGLWVITLATISKLQLAGSAVIIGAGIFSMHYSGMYAMQMSPSIQYDLALVALSGLIAIGASGAALIICRNIERVPRQYSLVTRLGAALIMGIAICGMHYTGMAAVTFMPDAMASADNTLRGNWMGIPTAVAASIFLLSLVYIAYEDYREMERVKREKAEADAAVMRAAFSDASSGLPNRTSLENHLDQLITDNQKKADPFDLIYVELSDYRQIIASHGDDVAQSYVSQFAKAIQKATPGGAYVARYNTNGFVVVMPDAGLATLKQSARALTEALSKTQLEDVQDLPLRFGLGYSQYPQSGTVTRMLIRQAQVIKLRYQPETSRSASADALG